MLFRPSHALAAACIAGLAASAAADIIVVNFDVYPGPDGRLGTPDDVPITAPPLFTTQTLQITNEFASVGVLFRTPPIEDANEILDNASFTLPPGITEPNLLGASGALSVEGSFSIPVFEVGAIIGISGGADRLEAYDASNNLLGSRVGDDEFVSISSTVPITRFVIVAASGITAAIDNLTFDTGGTTPCYPNCDGSTVQPILNVSDFICFQTRFAASDTYANCDGSTIEPVLNVTDFICFQTAFAAGCS